jgi:hypothetical protein
MTGGDRGERKTGAAARAERLAAALKQNLKKRKEQARARRRAESVDVPAPPKRRDDGEG